MQVRNALVVFAFVFLYGGEARAQDSSRADWRQWFAIKDSVVRCQSYPTLMQFLGPAGEWTTHRTPSGGTCHAGPGPGDPTAWVIDSVLFCPDSSPTTWADAPRKAPHVDDKNIREVSATRDTAVLRSLSCAIRPRAALFIRTRRPSR